MAQYRVIVRKSVSKDLKGIPKKDVRRILTAIKSLADDSFILGYRMGANAPDLADEIRFGVDITEPAPRVVLVDFESVTEVDATALITIRQLIEDLEHSDIDLRLAQVRTRVRALMQTMGLDDFIGHDHIYDSIQDGVDAFLEEEANQAKLQQGPSENG